MKHAFTLALLLACSLILAETWIYEKTVVELPMGEGEGQLSVRRWDDMHEGPTSFTIDEDENIYVLTRRKDIIMKFDRNGAYICSSQYVKGAGDPIRFLGYHDGIVYTMSGNSDRPWVRRYNQNLEFIDSYPIQKPKNTFNGLSFIENKSGQFGLLRNSDPRNISASELVLSNNAYQYENMELFDATYKPVELHSVWPSEIGYRFMNNDTLGNLYFEKYVAPGCATELGVVNPQGGFVSTNVVFDTHMAYGIYFYDRIMPIVAKNGNAYNLLLTEKRIEYVRWQKIGEEQ